MTDSFKDRESQFEAKFAHDEELKFKAVSLRNRLFAAWVAEQLGTSAPAGYAEALREFGFGRKTAELVERALHDLRDGGVSTSDIRLWKAMEHCEDHAHLAVEA